MFRAFQLMIDRPRYSGYLIVYFAICCGVYEMPAEAAKRKTTSPAEFESELDDKMTQFKKAHQTARTKFLKKFDVAINAVRKSPGTAQQKIARIEQIEKLKHDFETTGTLPSSDDCLEASIAYCEMTFKATVPLREFFERELQNALAEKPLRDRIQGEYETWIAQIPNADALSSVAKWHGHRIFRKQGNAVDIHIHINSCEGDSFTGSIWQDVQNVYTKSGMAFEGRYVGNRVQLETTNVLHGKARKWMLTGFVVEGRMILEVTGVDANGHAIPADLVSVRKE